MAKSWYILHTYTGYEQRIEKTIRMMLDSHDIDSNIVTDVRVPIEETVEVRDGKQYTRKHRFLPGYLMVEMDLPELDWKKTCTALRRIKGVTGFVGTKPTDRPIPISVDEAKNLLQKSGVIKGKPLPYAKQSFLPGDQVKINDGPFATFTGEVDEVNAEKDKLRVIVQIFGRATPVEVSLSQVEKV